MPSSVEPDRFLGVLRRLWSGGIMLLGRRRGGLIDKLVELAHGDVDLVQRAINESSGQMGTSADLGKVMKYIQEHNAAQAQKKERSAA